MPPPTAMQETFVFNFVGDGFLHVPKRHRYININSAFKPAQNNTYYYKFGDLRVEALDLVRHTFFRH